MPIPTKRASLLVVLALPLLPLGVFADDVEPLPRVAPSEPAAAVTTFHVEEGFELQLVAAEPLTTDPIDMQFDEFGRAWVVEMRDYPYTDKSSDKPFVERTADAPLGRVRILEDTDGDGRFDRSVVFADDLSWPTGIALWNGGCFVVATPDLWWLKDMDGDSKADERRAIFSGFRKFNVQAVVNNLEWGLDHRLYAAGSSNGGTIRRGDDPTSTAVVLPTADFRFSPREPSGPIELLTGGARFGNAFNDEGDRFVCNIRNPIQHPLIPREVLARNPAAPAKTGVVDVAESGDQLAVFRASPAEPWRTLNSKRLAFDPTLAAPRSESVAVGYMTSACGLTIYRGDAYPDSLRGSVFIAEPSANLVHHQTLSRDGASYVSTRSLDRREFVASTDNWFRPVNFAHAPDGTLYVLDMYRETIEHPWSIPDDIKARLDLESGRDRGRIYRLAPRGFHPRPTPRLGELSTLELVPLLEHPNAWHRDTTHRLLFERQDPAAIEPLRRLARTSPRAFARLHALWSLHGLAGLTAEDLTTAIADESWFVRRAAVQLSTDTAASAADRETVLATALRDDDPSVRLQALFSLRELPVEGRLSIESLDQAASRDVASEPVRAAVLSLVRGERAAAFVDSWFKRESQPADRLFLLELCQTIGTEGNAPAMEALFRAIAAIPDVSKADFDPVAPMLVGLGAGRARTGVSLRATLAAASPATKNRAQATLEQAMATVADAQATTAKLEEAIGLIAHLEPARIRAALEPLLTTESSAATQTAAVRALGRIGDEDLPRMLLTAYPTLRAEARREVVETLLAAPKRHPALLDAVDAGVLQPFDVPHLRRNALVRSTDPLVKERAIKLFAAALEQRREVFERYRAAIRVAKSDQAQGEAVFRRECATCHKVNDVGRDIGPNLATIRNRAPDEVLLHVLDPNREVAPNFVAYTATLKSGRSLSGIVQSEDAARIVLTLATGTNEELARAEIEELTPTGMSLMPVGLESRVTTLEMSDLLEFLLK